MQMKKCVIMLAFIFFVLYAYLPLSTPPTFTSPDENMNYFFSKLYAEEGVLCYTEELNEFSYGIFTYINRSFFRYNSSRFPSFYKFNIER